MSTPAGGGLARLRTLVVSLAACLPLGGAIQPEPPTIPGFLYARTVEVTRPGPQRVELDLAALSHMHPSGRDLHLFAPDGRELARRLERAPDAAGEQPAAVAAVEPRDGGWWVRIDAGSDPSPHRALRFEFRHDLLAPAVRLEASGDGAAWRSLVERDLFRLGDEAGAAQFALDYEPTSDRHLRLAWPGEAGFPAVERIRLVRGPSRAIEQRVERPASEPGQAGGARYRMRLDAPGAVRLRFELDASGALGYRLAVARAGRWETTAEGLWALGAGAPARRSLPLAPVGQRSDLRLELYGEPTPRLVAWTAEYPARAVLFTAETTGLHTLAYGSHRATTRTAPATDSPLASRLEPGPETAFEPPPPETARPAQALDVGTASASWTVTAPGAEVASVVRLELPAGVYPLARRDLGNLRLSAAGRELPYLAHRPDLPVAVGARQRVSPEPSGRGRSRVETELPAGTVRLSQLELTADDAPFRRLLRVGFPDPAPKAGEPAETWRGGWRAWACEDHGPLPCRFELALDGVAAARLIVELDDGDNPPLGRLETAAWRRRDELVFVWPERGPVTLVAAARNVRPPRYDLTLAADRLLARPWVPAELDLAAATGAAAERGRLGRMVLYAALALAAVALLALLYRMLRAPGDGGAAAG